jgi:1,4-dihydroxy-2-naphthoyl-CoA synthase
MKFLTSKTTVPEFHTIELSIKDDIAQLTLNRPDSANAMNTQMAEEILTVLTGPHQHRTLGYRYLSGQCTLRRQLATRDRSVRSVFPRPFEYSSRSLNPVDSGSTAQYRL